MPRRAHPRLRAPRARRGGPRHPRPRLPLHALVRRSLAAARRRGCPRRRAARRRPPDAALPRAGRHHPGLGGPLRPRAARPHDHRQPDEHAAADLGGRADRRRALRGRRAPAHRATARAHPPRRRLHVPHLLLGCRDRGAAARRRPSRAPPTTPAGRAGRPGASTASRSTTARPATPGCSRRRVAAPTTSSPTCPADRVAVLGSRLQPTAATTPRDSSAAAIAVCGLLELAELETDAERAARYRQAADDILDSLVRSYTPASPRTRTRCSCTASTTCRRTSASTRAPSGATTSTSRRSRAGRAGPAGARRGELMRFVSYRHPSGVRVGSGRRVRRRRPRASTCRASSARSCPTMAGSTTRALPHVAARAGRDCRCSPTSRWRRPVRPGKIVCLGYNYRGHVADGATDGRARSRVSRRVRQDAERARSARRTRCVLPRRARRRRLRGRDRAS